MVRDICQDFAQTHVSSEAEVGPAYWPIADRTALCRCSHTLAAGNGLEPCEITCMQSRSSPAPDCCTLAKTHLTSAEQRQQAMVYLHLLTVSDPQQMQQIVRAGY